MESRTIPQKNTQKRFCSILCTRKVCVFCSGPGMNESSYHADLFYALIIDPCYQCLTSDEASTRPENSRGVLSTLRERWHNRRSEHRTTAPRGRATKMRARSAVSCPVCPSLY